MKRRSSSVNERSSSTINDSAPITRPPTSIGTFPAAMLDVRAASSGNRSTHDTLDDTQMSEP